MVSRNYMDLIAWQKAMDLAEDVYRLTKVFPKEELYGLTSQIRRAVVSAPSNIAEGQGRGGVVEFVRFLHIAHGSLREVETPLMLACRLKSLTEADKHQVLSLAAEVGRLLNGLMRSKRL